MSQGKFDVTGLGSAGLSRAERDLRREGGLTAPAYKRSKNPFQLALFWCISSIQSCENPPGERQEHSYSGHI